VVWGSIHFPQKRTRCPQVPDSTRIYAVGDIHGRCDLIDQLLLDIGADLARRPIARPVVVFLGDYIDRGPESASVLDRLIACNGAYELVCLKGNHEALLLQFLDDPAHFADWIRYGGLCTLLSYGLGPCLNQWADVSSEVIAEEFHRALPQSHRLFLAGLGLSYACGDYFFVHAGVRAGVPLDEQSEHDLLWIRDDFLLHEDFFEKIVVHGHTPVAVPEVMPNRINIDTGAYATGRLTCLVLERDHLQFLHEIACEARG
jgi:serine/threonine protein phosphatase 1